MKLKNLFSVGEKKKQHKENTNAALPESSFNNFDIKKERKEESAEKKPEKKYIRKFKELYRKETPQESYFYVRDGQVIRNLEEFVPCLVRLSDEMFRFHANSFKNDFYNWIIGVFNDGILGDSIKNVKDRQEMIQILSSMLYEDVEISQPEKKTEATESKQEQTNQESISMDIKKEENKLKISQEIKDREMLVEELARQEIKNVTDEEKSYSEADKKGILDTENLRKEVKELEQKYSNGNRKILNKPVYTIPKNVEDAVFALNNQYMEIKEKAKELRKSGKDTTMLELTLIRIPAKIKLYQATEDEKDKSTVQEMLIEAKKEIQDISS